MNYWSWGGKYVGKRSGDVLYSRRGNPLGRFYGDELYDFSGKYIGEIRSGNRLIVNKTHKHKRASISSKPCGIVGSSYCDYVGYAMLAGYEDFTLE